MHTPIFSRRAALSYAVGIAATAVIAACGSDDETAASTPATPPATSPTATTPTATDPAATAAPTTEAAAETTAAPTAKIVETVYGQVEVPANPQRIVCLNFVDTACLLDLGVTPIGMNTSGVNFLPEYADAMKAIPEVTDAATFEFNLELIASLEPDLIIGSDWLATDQRYVPFDELSQIAPTAIVEWQQSAGNWPAQAEFFADVVGKSSEFEALRDTYESRADEIKAGHAAALAAHKWALIQGGLGEWYFYTPQSSHGQVFARVGVQFADINSDEPGGFVTMSEERVGDLAPADVIALNTNVSAQEGAAELQGLELYKTLPAVTSGHVYPMTWFFPSSYKVAGALLEEIDGALTALG